MILERGFAFLVVADVNEAQLSMGFLNEVNLILQIDDPIYMVFFFHSYFIESLSVKKWILDLSAIFCCARIGWASF